MLSQCEAALKLVKRLVFLNWQRPVKSLSDGLLSNSCEDISHCCTRLNQPQALVAHVKAVLMRLF